MTAAALCAIALTFGHAGPAPVARATCEHVAASAVAHGVDPVVVVALAWHESRMSPVAVSRAGAVGPMQVMRWLYRRAVDVTGAGVGELARLLGRHRIDRALCHYNGGLRCTERGLRWARSVMRMAERLRLDTVTSGMVPDAPVGLVFARPSLSDAAGDFAQRRAE